MPSCAVPTCAGQSHRWIVPFPQHSTLKVRWVRALVAGTGLDLPARHQGTVCGWHFGDDPVEESYREPVRFLNRNGKIVTVASCRFCQRFDDQEEMVPTDRLLKSADLSFVIEEVLKVELSRDDLLGTVCKRCNSRLTSLVQWINESKVREEEYKMFELVARTNRTKVEGFVAEKDEVQLLVAIEKLVEPEEDPLQLPEETHSSEVEEIEEEILMPEPMVLKVEEDEEQVIETLEEPIQKFHYPPNTSAKRGRAKRSDPAPKKPKFRDILSRKCYICHNLLPSHEDLAAHLASEHLDQSTYKCIECNKSFKIVTSYNRHLGFHDQQNRPQKCHFCAIGFSHIYSLQRHENRYHGTTHEIYRKQNPQEKSFQCANCDKCFRANFLLIEHDRFVHQKLPGAICKLCGKHFRNRASLRKHNLVHTGHKPYECEQCEAAFKSSWHLNNHVARFHGERPDGKEKEPQETSDEDQ